VSYPHTSADCPARTDLSKLAEKVVRNLVVHFDTDRLAIQQVLCLAEEAGEFVGAYRRWAGMARRSGPWEDVKAELADVAITAFVTAQVLGIDLDEAVREKTETIMSRGWRDKPAEVSR
jgi:NTP pyrophosphatase (non-canonical NTP hydrolase)